MMHLCAGVVEPELEIVKALVFHAFVEVVKGGMSIQRLRTTC